MAPLDERDLVVEEDLPDAAISGAASLSLAQPVVRAPVFLTVAWTTTVSGWVSPTTVANIAPAVRTSVAPDFTFLHSGFRRPRTSTWPSSAHSSHPFRQGEASPRRFGSKAKLRMTTTATTRAGSAS